jgi:hypothetical protein
MQRRTVLSALSAVPAACLLIALAVPAGEANANDAKKIVGAWSSPVSASYGDNPRGLLVFSSDGYYSLTILRANLPKVASNNRTKATPQEEHAIVEGSINHFGRYKVDAKKKILTFQIEGSTFPNWIGTTQERPFSIKDGVLTYKVAAASGTGQPGETSWRRAK